MWSLTDAPSGGTIDAAMGTYHAGGTPGVSDTVHVQDDLGNSAEVSVSVGTGITINPSSPDAGAPWHHRLRRERRQRARLLVGHGLRRRPAGRSSRERARTPRARSGNVTDHVKVTDSLGNTKTIAVTVGPQVSMSPLGPSIPPRGSISFGATGGSGGYGWSLAPGPSGGTINAGSGLYVAGTTGSVTDTVKVLDSNGNSVTTGVTVGPGVTVAPAAATVAPRQSKSFVASGGSGGVYTWTFVQNASNGSLDAERRLHRGHDGQRHGQDSGEGFARQHRERHDHGRRGHHVPARQPVDPAARPDHLHALRRRGRTVQLRGDREQLG